MVKMKNSGIEWLGEIPETWEVVKIKYFLTRNEVKNHPNATVLSVYRDYGVVLKDSRDDNHNVTSNDTSNYKYVMSGDLVINKMKAWQGSLAVSKYTGIVSPAYYVYQFKNQKLNRNYFHYLIRNCYKNEFKRLSTGIRDGQWDLQAYDFENTFILLPSKAEQQQIADYLDHKTAEIDNLIDKINIEIDTLKQYQSSVITQAVTKGLNPNVPMKDSGIEWISEIPETWKVIKAKYIFIQRSSKGNKRNLDLLSPTQNYGVIPQNMYEKITGMKPVKIGKQKDLKLFKTIHKGDFCISLRSFEGGFEYSHYEGVVSPAYQVFYCTDSNSIDSYYKYLFKDKTFINKMNSYTMSLRDGKNIAFSDFGNTFITVPPKIEQQKIANFLDQEVSRIQKIIKDKQQQINQLTEYKNSLIFEYVTGKKQVKEVN